MSSKFALTVFFLVSLAAFGQTLFAQTKCQGEKIFNEKKCVGDEVNTQEKELYRIVNEYRAQNNLPAIPLSDSLSIVANRHLLDLILNIKTFTHGWSNCPYNIKDSNTWNCIFEAPKRLKVDYSGSGYENLYRNNGGNATPVLALEAWKKSAMHNALILNLDSWKNTKFNAFGIAINGQLAALWFGSAAEIKNNPNNANQPGLGVTFDKAVTGLTKIISIKKSSSSVESEQWSGSSKDKSVLLEVTGTEADVSRATIAIKIKLENKAQISAKNRGVLSVFLNNLASEWSERENWANAAIKNLQSNPNIPQTINQGNKTITMTIDAQNYLSITVKPYVKPVAKEIR